MEKSIFSIMRLFVLAILPQVIIQSCKKVEKEFSSVTMSDNIQRLQLAVANSTGLTLDKVVYSATRKAFVVDGDGIISLEDARARFVSDDGIISSANETAQRKFTYTVAASETNINVYADVSVPADWIVIIDQALANWNNAGCAIKFTRIASSLLTNITVNTSYDSTSNVIAAANYPNMYGNPGKYVTINTYYSFLSTEKKLFAITHEFGHTIGFTHTDGTYGSLIAGTPKSDPNSIMNSVCLSWVSFTDYDIKAFKIVYPADGSTTTQNGNGNKK